jgi:hypothetical protein
LQKGLKIRARNLLSLNEYCLKRHAKDDDGRHKLICITLLNDVRREQRRNRFFVSTSNYSLIDDFLHATLICAILLRFLEMWNRRYNFLQLPGKFSQMNLLYYNITKTKTLVFSSVFVPPKFFLYMICFQLE